MADTQFDAFDLASLSCQTKETRTGAVQDLWRWQIYGQNCRPFLEAIRPYVRLKGDQIDLFLDILSVLPGRGKYDRSTSTVAVAIVEASRQIRLLKRGTQVG